MILIEHFLLVVLRLQNSNSFMDDLHNAAGLDNN